MTDEGGTEGCNFRKILDVPFNRQFYCSGTTLEWFKYPKIICQ
jgi:hypothetical protein